MTCIGAFGRDLGTVAATALASTAVAAAVPLDFFYPLIIIHFTLGLWLLVTRGSYVLLLLILHLISLRFRSASAMFWVSSTIFLFIFYSFLVLLILFFLLPSCFVVSMTWSCPSQQLSRVARGHFHSCSEIGGAASHSDTGCQEVTSIY